MTSADRPAVGPAENPTLPALPVGGSSDLPQLRLPSNVLGVLDEARLSVGRTTEGGWSLRQYNDELQRLTDLPHATVTGSLGDDGRVTLETQERGGVPVRLVYDTANRSLTYDMGRYHHESRVPATMPELARLSERAAARDPTLIGSSEVRVNGHDVETLRNLYGRVAPEVLRDMSYVASGVDLGSRGITTNGRAFIDSARLASGDVTSRQSTVHNELSHVAWDRMAQNAYRRANPNATGDIPFDVRSRLSSDNYFEGFRGPSNVTIANNLQANEIVSDAASIGTNALDYYRVLEFARPGATVPRAYRATVDLARRLAANAIGEEALTRGLAATDRPLPDIVPPSRLGVIQAQYVAAGRAIVERYNTELQQRFPAALARRTAS